MLPKAQDSPSLFPQMRVDIPIASATGNQGTPSRGLSWLRALGERFSGHEAGVEQWESGRIGEPWSDTQRVIPSGLGQYPFDRGARVDHVQAHRARASRISSVPSGNGRPERASSSRSSFVRDQQSAAPSAWDRIALASHSMDRPCRAARCFSLALAGASGSYRTGPAAPRARDVGSPQRQQGLVLHLP